MVVVGDEANAAGVEFAHEVVADRAADLHPLISCIMSWLGKLSATAGSFTLTTRRQLLKDHERQHATNAAFVRNCEMACYLPFEDKHVAQEAPVLPPFRRSIVLRVPADATEGVVHPH